MSDVSSPQPHPVGRWIAFGLILALLTSVFLMAVRTMMPEKELPKLPTYESWPEEVVEIARAIPVHDGGRVKPLETYASYVLLSMRGDRTIRVEGEDDETIKVKPTEWMLDALFRPEMATKLPTFRVDNSDVFETIGMEGKEKRDRYSYSELEEHLPRLMQVGTEFDKLLEKGMELSTVQKQTRELAYNVAQFEALLTYFSFARTGVEFRGFSEDGSDDLKPMSVVMAMSGVLRDAMRQAGSLENLPPQIALILQQVETLANRSVRGLVIIPPKDKEVEQWRPVGQVIYETAILGTYPEPEQAVKDVQAMEELVYAAVNGKEGDFAKELAEWQGNLEERARARGEYRAIPIELSYNEGNWFFRATFFAFVPGCIFLVLSWLSPRSKLGRIMNKLVWVFASVGLVMIIIGTVQRVIITERPPVTGLYDTIPFITAGVIIVAMIAELLTRRRLAIAVTPIVGFVGLVLARLYEFGDASDPNDPIIAVLRSNFWLSTHVLTITFGYAAGFVVAALGLVYMFMRILKLDGGDKSLRRLITRMTFGCVCFTLFLSLVGTVLGGIWANYSWGRFWGWDPKENGALLIVIWMLFILHARLGGFIKEWGINLCGVFTAVIVTFSWWHVNLLGVGLHSYGFSESRKVAVFIFYGLMGIVMSVGIGFAMYDYFSARAKKKQRRESGPLPQPDGLPAK